MRRGTRSSFLPIIFSHWLFWKFQVSSFHPVWFSSFSIYFWRQGLLPVRVYGLPWTTAGFPQRFWLCSIILIVTVWTTELEQAVMNTQRIYHLIAELFGSLRGGRGTAKWLLCLQKLQQNDGCLLPAVFLHSPLWKDWDLFLPFWLLRSGTLGWGEVKGIAGWRESRGNRFGLHSELSTIRLLFKDHFRLGLFPRSFWRNLHSFLIVFALTQAGGRILSFSTASMCFQWETVNLPRAQKAWVLSFSSLIQPVTDEGL